MKVWDVLLPEWCGGDPRVFSLIHRQALESDYITQHLPAWIDLVFGIKQTGKAAIDSINVFHPAVSCFWRGGPQIYATKSYFVSILLLGSTSLYLCMFQISVFSIFGSMNQVQYFPLVKRNIVHIQLL